MIDDGIEAKLPDHLSEEARTWYKHYYHEHSGEIREPAGEYRLARPELHLLIDNDSHSINPSAEGCAPFR